MPYVVIMHYSCIFGEQCVVFTNEFLICGLDLMHEDLINVHIFSCFESVFSTYCSEICFNSQQGGKQNVRKVCNI